MTAFHDVRFPVSVAFGSAGGPERRTEIVTLGSGREERNTPWSQSRRRYDAGVGLTSLDQLHQVIAFFEARRGRLYGFRWKDHLDFKSCAPLQAVSAIDQAIGTGNGVVRTFQLMKAYGDAAGAYQRRVTRPQAETVRIAVNGVALTADDFVVDAASGVVTLDAAPSAGAAVTAGFVFDVPVRFDSDRLSVNLAAFRAGDAPHIPLVEIVDA